MVSLSVCVCVCVCPEEFAKCKSRAHCTGTRDSFQSIMYNYTYIDIIPRGSMVRNWPITIIMCVFGIRFMSQRLRNTTSYSVLGSATL